MAAVQRAKKNADSSPACKYGSKCYRKNPQHIQQFSHPGKNEDEEKETGVKASRDTGKGKQKKHITDFFGGGKKTERAKDDIDSKQDASDEPVPKKKKFMSDPGPVSQSSMTDEPSGDEIAEDEEGADNAEDTESPASPDDVKENIKSKFLVEMPEDFYQFWELCKSLNPKSPSDALQKVLKLRLVGPFDILAQKHKGISKNRHKRRPNFLLHYRYYYDPPEFQTVIAADDEEKFHLGYYRDDPKECPVFVASNSPASPSREKIYPCGQNLFAAVHIYASKKAKSVKGPERRPFDDLIKKIENEAGNLGFSLDATTKEMKQRQKKVVCPTFHGAGLVVPVDDNEVGYRPIPETPKSLRAMLKRICESASDTERDLALDELQEIITLVQFANDECDYGEGLELGIDLFSFGGKALHPQCESVLTIAYMLLQRPEFGKIIEAHLKHRTPVDGCVDELR